MFMCTYIYIYIYTHTYTYTYGGSDPPRSLAGKLSEAQRGNGIWGKGS